MTEIIKPQFERKLVHKKRMLRTNPALAKHPEFEDAAKTTLVLPYIAMLLLTAAFVALGRR